MNTTRISVDGTYPIPRFNVGGNADKLIILASGTYGTATLHLNVLNGAGNWIPLDGGEIVVDVQRVLHAGLMLRFAIVVTSANGATDIILDSEETG